MSQVMLSRQGETGTGGLPTRPPPPRAVRKLFCRADADTRHARPPSPPMARHHHGPRCRTPQLGCHGHFASARSRPEVGDHPRGGVRVAADGRGRPGRDRSRRESQSRATSEEPRSRPETEVPSRGRDGDPGSRARRRSRGGATSRARRIHHVVGESDPIHCHVMYKFIQCVLKGQ